MNYIDTLKLIKEKYSKNYKEIEHFKINESKFVRNKRRYNTINYKINILNRDWNETTTNGKIVSMVDLEIIDESQNKSVILNYEIDREMSNKELKEMIYFEIEHMNDLQKKLLFQN